MIVKKNDLISLIQEEVKKQDKRQLLNVRIQELQEAINNINENSVLLKELVGTGVDLSGKDNIGSYPSYSPPGTPEQQLAKSGNKKEIEPESIYSSKPGQGLVLNFQDTTIKVARQHDNIFKVTDATQSKVLKDGDLIQLIIEKGEHKWEVGRKYRFKFLNRQEGKAYDSNALMSWEHVKM